MCRLKAGVQASENNPSYETRLSLAYNYVYKMSVTQAKAARGENGGDVRLLGSLFASFRGVVVQRVHYVLLLNAVEYNNLLLAADRRMCRERTHPFTSGRSNENEQMKQLHTINVDEEIRQAV